MLIEIIATVVVVLFTIMLSVHAPAIARILICALSIRLVAVLYHTSIAPLPDSGADALHFQHLAEAWSYNGYWHIFQHYPGASGYIYSWFLAFVYVIDGPSPYSAQLINVGFGVAAVYLTYLIGSELWGSVIGRRPAWLVALFPSMILYSSITLRESIIVACFLGGVLFAIRWQKGRGTREVLKATGCFLAGGIFHGAMLLAVGALAIGALVVGLDFRRGITRASLPRLGAASFIALTTVALAITEVELPKVGKLSEAANEEDVADRTNIAARGGAAYPSWLMPRSGVSSVSLLPPRMLYLLGAPFPWDVRGAHHLVGLADGVVYCGLLFLIWRRRHQIAHSPGALMVLLITMAMVAIFAMGVSNFGTGLRHRAKFFAVLAVLAAPALPRIYTGK